jgi:ADP-heptose:LPS heptosyltransferase
MKILVFRFSAMGDVALCLPVLKAVLAYNPEVEITFVTRRSFAFLFEGIPRLKVYIAEFENSHKGFKGLIKLSRELKKQDQYDYICDLHQVLRSQILNKLFWNVKKSKINKERSAKNKFRKKPIKQYLKHTTLRYLEVFFPLGLKLPTKISELLNYGYEKEFTNSKVENLLAKISSHKIIGIAPFARHFTKIWPFEHLDKLLQILSKRENTSVLLFGGPEDENKLGPCEQKYSNVINLAGVYNLEEELALMKKLSVMVAMDSANMHFATLCRVPVVSIWGGTHPGFGFYPIDHRSVILEVEPTELTCRPCSLFGKSECPVGHFKCMYDISPERVANEVLNFL